jgi:hypothetical protein
MKKPFKFGERVIVLKNGHEPNGPGKIWEYDEGWQLMLGVRFDKKFRGGGILSVTTPSCAKGHGWYVERKYIRRIKTQRRST